MPHVSTSVRGRRAEPKPRAIHDGADVSRTDDTPTMATTSPSVLSLPWALPRFVPMLATAVARAAGHS